MPAPQQPNTFGEWLKLRRLAAELTQVDLARYLGVEIPVYKDIELGKHGITEEHIKLLVKLEKMKVTERDIRAKNPTIQKPAEGEKQPAPATVAPPPKTSSPLDAILASVAAKQERDAKRQERPRSPLGTFLAAEIARAGISKVDAARLCRVTPDLFDDIDAGFLPGPPVLRKLAEGLGLPMESLEREAARPV